MNKKRKKIVRLCWVLGILLCFMVLFILLGGIEKVQQIIFNFKKPTAYTWDDYQSMDNEQKDDFFQRFDTVEDFETWQEAVRPKETEPDFHWDQSGKQPDEYNWEEFNALAPEQKEAFYQWFSSEDEFENWQDQVKPEETTTAKPTWNDQTKQPDQYTWEEYQALTPEEQDAFYLWFDTMAEFEAWMDAVKPVNDEPENASWNKPGKNPDQYSWDEYQALTPEEQDLFYLWFETMEAFEAWLDQTQP